MHVSATTQKYFTLDQILQDVPETDTEELTDPEEAYQNYVDELNFELKTDDRVTDNREWLEFQAGHCEKFGKAAKFMLYRIVKSSVDHPENSKAAANAITILKVMNVSFACLDLKGIKIPHADLSGAILDRANFSKADLTLVNLKNASLNQAKMKKAILKGVKLGPENFILFQGNFGNRYCYSYETSSLFIAPESTRNMHSTYYIFDTSSRTIKEAHSTERLVNKDNIICSKYSFVSNNTIALLEHAEGAYKVYVMNCNFDRKRVKISSTPIAEFKNSIVSIFQDYLVNITESNNKFSRIFLWKFYKTKNKYEINSCVDIPYKIFGEYLYLSKAAFIPYEINFSTTNPVFAFNAVNCQGEYECIIFNYEVGRITCCVGLDMPFSQVVFSTNMQYLALVQYDKLSIYTLNKKNGLLNAELVIGPKKINITTIFYPGDYLGKTLIQFICNDKYLIFVNDRSELGIFDGSKREEEKILSYSTGFKISDFYVIPNLAKVMIFGENIADTISLDTLINNATNPVSSIGILFNKNDSVILRLQLQAKGTDDELIMIRKYRTLPDGSLDSFQISSLILSSNNKLLENTDELKLNFFDEKKTDNSLSIAEFSPNNSYIIVRHNLNNKILSEGEIIELYNYSSKNFFYRFPDNTYTAFSLSSDDEYAICVTACEEVKVWHIPSKKLLYSIERCPLDGFNKKAVISKKYIVLFHQTHLNIIPLERDLKAFSKIFFSDCGGYKIYKDFKIDDAVYTGKFHGSFQLYNDHMLAIAFQDKIYVYDLDNNLNNKEVELSNFGEIIKFDISSKQGVMVVYSNENNIATVSLFDINTWIIFDRTSYRCFFYELRFSALANTIIGRTTFDQIYVWNIKKGKLYLKYKTENLFETLGLDLTEAEVDDEFKNLLRIIRQ